jgi:hypothetical protein
MYAVSQIDIRHADFHQLLREIGLRVWDRVKSVKDSNAICEGYAFK